jgi:hypothetical protein
MEREEGMGYGTGKRMIYTTTCHKRTVGGGRGEVCRSPYNTPQAEEDGLERAIKDVNVRRKSLRERQEAAERDVEVLVRVRQGLVEVDSTGAFLRGCRCTEWVGMNRGGGKGVVDKKENGKHFSVAHPHLFIPNLSHILSFLPQEWLLTTVTHNCCRALWWRP